ncbi:hypothetical protein D3C77_768510 [compost metagenome]
MFSVHPGEVEGVDQQLLHVVYFTPQAFAQLLGRQIAVVSDAQARQWCAQFVGQGT